MRDGAQDFILRAEVKLDPHNQAKEFGLVLRAPHLQLGELRF